MSLLNFNVLSNSSGYKQIKVINDILEDDQNAIIDLEFDYSPEEIVAFYLLQSHQLMWKEVSQHSNHYLLVEGKTSLLKT